MYFRELIEICMVSLVFLSFTLLDEGFGLFAPNLWKNEDYLDSLSFLNMEVSTY